MNAYYQDVITEKSWKILKLVKTKINFVLIGGWAVYLYTQALKSKDIDIIVDYSDLGTLKEDFNITKNERLSKYEIKAEGIDIDIYLPHYSDLGIPVEEIVKYTDKIEGYAIPQKEMLILTKLKAYRSRQGSIKGEKDKIDIISLLLLPDFDYERYCKFIKQYDFTHFNNLLKKLLENTYEIPEIGLNRHMFSKMKKNIMYNIK